MAAEPGFDDSVATHTLVDAAGDGLHLRQFRHRSIVEDRGLADARRGSPRQMQPLPVNRRLIYSSALPGARILERAAKLHLK
jgi:hypothetical protein